MYAWRTCWQLMGFQNHITPLVHKMTVPHGGSADDEDDDGNADEDADE